VSDSSELEALYIPWHDHKQSCRPISQAVYYLGAFTLFGSILPRHYIWRIHKANTPKADWNKQIYRSQAFQEKALDAALEGLKDCVVLSTTASHHSQFQAACLLKERGFRLLEGLCYKHPGYPGLSKFEIEHPGVPDRYLHWEHIWWRVIGTPKEIGAPSKNNQLNNCGVDSLCGLEQLKAHDAGPDYDAGRRNILTVAWLPRGTLFPEGWKRFYSAQDYKLGVNFTSKALSNVQKCPHDFDLEIFKDWEPDFEKWSPS